MSTATTSDTHPEEADHNAETERKRIMPILGGLMLAMSLASLDQSIVNTALPSMASDLGGLAHLSWVVTAFMLSSTVATPIFGKLSDMYGRKPLLLSAICLFLMMSILCGVAQSMGQLILFRLLQGIGAGGIMTLCQTAISDTVTPRQRVKYQGLFTATFAMSAVSGPILGGVLTTWLSWRWVFYINIPLAFCAIFLLWRSLPSLQNRRQHKIDFAGAFTMMCAASSSLLLFSLAGSLFEWDSLPAALLAGFALVSVIVFILIERKAVEPIMTLSLFSIRNFVIGSVTTGCMGFAMMSAMVFLPLYFQLVLGLNPAESGAMLLPQVIAMMLTSVFGGHISSKINRPKIFMMGGIALEAVGLSMIATLAYFQVEAHWFLCALAILGLGMGVAMPHATVIVQNAAPKGTMGEATATMAFIRSLGGVLGVAVSGGVMKSTLYDGISHISPDIDIQTIIDTGMDAVVNLPASIRPEIELAYSQAITVSFEIGGAVMLFAFCLSMLIKHQKLSDG